jgi:hypothetical protein
VELLTKLKIPVLNSIFACKRQTKEMINTGESSCVTLTILPSLTGVRPPCFETYISFGVEGHLRRVSEYTYIASNLNLKGFGMKR